MPRILTDALREIRRTFGRFLSLFLLSALAVAFLAGLRTTAPDMEVSADAYFDAQRLMDVHILSTLGLTDDDITFLAAQPGVAHAEGAYTADAIVHGADADQIVKVLSLTDGVNLPRLVSGRLPENDRECLVEPALLTALGLSLGDSLPLDTGTGTYENALTRPSYTIVGAADSPLYISIERGSSSLGSGRVSAFVLLPAAAFDMDAYTDAYLLADGTEDLLCYGDAYTDHMDALLDRLDPIGDDRASLRHDEIVGEAMDKLNDAQAEYDDAESEADEKLSDAAQELADARKELDDGWRDYYDGWATYHREIADAQEKIETAETVDLPDALQKLQDGEADYADGQTELSDGWTDYLDGLADYRQGVEDFESGRADYNNAYGELVSKTVEYNDAVTQLEDGEAEYHDGLMQYTAGLTTLQEGGRQLQEGEQALQKALDQLFEGRQQYSAGLDQLSAQSAVLAQLSTQYQTLQQGLAADGLADPDPQVMAALLAQAMGTELAATGSLQTFFDSHVAPLRALLAAQRDMAAAAGQDPAELDQILAALPADADALAGMFQTAPQDTITAYLTGLGASGAVLAQAQDELAKGQAALDSAANSLNWGEMEYQEGREKLSKSKKEFLDGVKESQDAYAQLTDARRELDDGWAELRSGGNELDDGWAQLDDARQTLADADAELTDARQQLDDALTGLRAGEVSLLSARLKLDDGWADYHQGLTDLADAKATLETESADGLQTLADALKTLQDGERDYADGLQEYEDAKAEADDKLSDARRELNDARRKIADIEDCKWYVLGRETNMGYVAFQQDAQRMGNLADLFPLIFFLVAALVCLTTMTRMVEEQRVQIGGLKALGYGRAAIAVKYVGYGLWASLLGGLAGLALGCTLIPWVIYNAWGILYTLGDLIIPFSPAISLASVGAAVATVTGAALLTCLGALTAVPAQLMRPKAPKTGKRVLLERIGPVWRRLSFTHKVTVRNLLRYKKRFFMTVVGIGGCTALIVTGFGLRDSIFSIMPKQYDELYTYTAQIGLVDDFTPDEALELTRALDRSPLVESYMTASLTSLTLESGSRSVDGYRFTATDPAHFPDYVHLRHRLDGQPVPLPDQGAVITEKLASLLGVGVGDSITLSGDRRVSVPITGIAENYIFHYVYLSPSAYEALYGEAPQPNLYLARYTEDTRETCDAVAADLLPLSGVTSVSRITDTRQTFQHSMEAVDYAVVLVICSAAALAFVVLFNLTNINITERLRELATLRVLGFYDRELSAYVFRENAVLTVFGVLAGLVMGKYLHQWLVLTVEIDMLMFGRTAQPASYLYAVVLTILFSVAVNLLAGRKLKKIDMVESLKTVE